jgi:hypothetical protein
MLVTLADTLLRKVLHFSGSHRTCFALKPVNKKIHRVAHDPATWLNQIVDLRLYSVRNDMWPYLLQELLFVKRVLCHDASHIPFLQTLPLRVEIALTWLPFPPFESFGLVALREDALVLSETIASQRTSLTLTWTGWLLGAIVGFTTGTSIPAVLDGYFVEPP